MRWCSLKFCVSLKLEENAETRIKIFKYFDKIALNYQKIIFIKKEKWLDYSCFAMLC